MARAEFAHTCHMLIVQLCRAVTAPSTARKDVSLSLCIFPIHHHWYPINASQEPATDNPLSALRKPSATISRSFDWEITAEPPSC